jgi:hypothetical protein
MDSQPSRWLMIESRDTLETAFNDEYFHNEWCYDRIFQYSFIYHRCTSSSSLK